MSTIVDALKSILSQFRYWAILVVVSQHATTSQTHWGRRAVSAEGVAAGELPVFGGCAGTRGAVRCTHGGRCKVSKEELLKDHRGSCLQGLG